MGKEAVNNKLITKKNAHQPVKTKGELTLEDLPPIEDLKISVSESECVAVGKVYQIVDKLGELSVTFNGRGQWVPIANSVYCLCFKFTE